MWTVAVLTASDLGAAGGRRDTSGELLRRDLAEIGTVVDYQVVPDETDRIIQQLQTWIRQGVSLVATTGGTGLGPRDVTPEATQAVVDRIVPGIAEVMRAESVKRHPFGMLSRGMAGVAGRTLIINFPGSPRAIEELVPVVLPVLTHALNLIGGRTEHEKSQ